MKRILSVASLALSCTACASIIEGTSQKILVNTNPPGATCTFERQGETIAQIDSTPEAATIRKTKDDITIFCSKPGYDQATYMNHSGIDAVTFGNIAVGGLIGWGVDSATGSDNKYDGTINLSLVPRPMAAMPPALPPAPGVAPTATPTAPPVGPPPADIPAMP